MILWETDGVTLSGRQLPNASAKKPVQAAAAAAAATAAKSSTVTLKRAVAAKQTGLPATAPAASAAAGR